MTGLHRPHSVGRFADAHVPLTGANAVPWASVVPAAHGLADVRESRFLRPYSARMRQLEPLRVTRITKAILTAAVQGTVCHVWWHPHNFGVQQDGNLANLRSLLEAFARLRDAHGMDSMTMAAAADAGTAAATGATPRDQPMPLPDAIADTSGRGIGP